MEQATDTPKRSKKPYILGCCGGGCLTLIAVIIGLILWLLSFTSDTPKVVMQPVNKQQATDVRTRYITYKKQLKNEDAETPTDSFVLAEDDINNFLNEIFSDEDAQRMQLRIQGSEVTGQVSWPLKLPDGSIKWVNGEGQFSVEFANDKLDIRLQELQVKDRDLPEGVMKGIRETNLGDELAKIPELNNELQNIERIEIKDGKVYVKLKSQTSSTGKPDIGPSDSSEPLPSN